MQKLTLIFVLLIASNNTTYGQVCPFSISLYDQLDRIIAKSQNLSWDWDFTTSFHKLMLSLSNTQASNLTSCILQVPFSLQVPIGGSLVVTFPSQMDTANSSCEATALGQNLSCKNMKNGSFMIFSEASPLLASLQIGLAVMNATNPSSSGSIFLNFSFETWAPENSCVILPSASAILKAASPITSASFAAASLVSGTFSLNMFICLVAMESLVNMQYLNINHSSIASTIYSEMSNSYIPNWISNFNNLDPELLIFPWGIFQKNQISSLYFDNFGGTLTEIMIHLSLLLAIGGFALTQTIERLSKSFVGRTYATIFSFFASDIFGTLQSQILFSLLQTLKVDLLLDTYSRLSFLMGYFSLTCSIGLISFCFFRVLTVFRRKKSNWRPTMSDQEGISTYIQIKWFEKKYAFLFEDVKIRSKNRFLFAFWLTGFNTVYILLIFSLQSIPVLQCLSIVVVVLSFILFPVMIKPFKRKVPKFLHFFNFACILIVALLNLVLAIIQRINPDFSGVEIQGWVVVSMIFLHTGVNTLISLGVLIFEVCKNIKTCKKRGDMETSSSSRGQPAGLTISRIEIIETHA
jgi:hypothetical protein